MGEQRFKVGDWVRVIDNRGAPMDYKKDDVCQVTAVRDDLVYSKGKPGMFAKRFEPWQPRVGERVNVKYGHGWNGEGEVVRFLGVSAVVLMKTGKCAGIEGGFNVSWLEPILSTATREQPATLKIEAGKFYKTRDGRKVGPIRLKATHGSDGPYRIDGLWNYLENGLVGSISNGDHKDDLIAEWIDEPVAKASTTTASNDNAQPKFKVGDRVKLARSFFGVAKVGATATVGERGMFSDYVDIVWDKNHLYQGQMNGGYSPDYFELLPASPPTTAIVALIENGQPKPSSTPHVHTSTGAAEKEAKRLAAKYKGQQFGVFTLTTTHEEAAPVYDHKWQNMAYLGLKIDAIKELRAVAGLTLKGAKDAVEAWIEYENAA